MFRKNVLMWLLLLGITSCYYDVEDELYVTVNCDLPAEVSFATNANPIIQQSCAVSGCHVSTVQDRVNLETYDEIKEVVDNGNFQSYTFINRSMPPSGPLSTCNIEMLKKWIENGAQNN